ncbi:hypothetical protein Tco_0637328 [Tanacetum coccineum]
MRALINHILCSRVQLLIPETQGGNIHPADKGLPSTASNEGTVKTTMLPEGPRGDKDSEGLKLPADMEPLTNPVADPLGTGAKDEDDVLEVGEEMDEDIPPTDEEVQSPPLNKEQPEPSHAQEANFDSSSLELNKYDNILSLTERQLVKYLRKVSRVLYNRITEDLWEKHEEATVSYVDLGAFIEGYYEENVDHKDQTDKLVQTTMNSLDKNST